MTDNLIKTHVKVKYTDARGKRRLKKINWLSFCEYLEGEGRVEIKFNPDIKPYLLNLQSFFTQIDFNTFTQIQDKYSMRFLMLTIKWKKIGKKEYPIDELKLEVGVEDGKYKDFYDFKRFVLEVARKTLFKTSNDYFTWAITKKRGKAATHITLFTHEKKKNKLKDDVPILLSPLVNKLTTQGISEKTAVKLSENEKAEFLEWVIPIIKARKVKLRKKGEKIFDHEKYCLKVIETQRDNFRAEWEHKKKVEANKKKRLEREKAEKLEKINGQIRVEYDRYVGKLAMNEYENLSENEKFIIHKKFEKHMQKSDKYKDQKVLQSFTEKGIHDPIVRIDFRIFVSNAWEKENKYTKEKYIKEQNYEIKETDETYLLLKDGEKIRVSYV